MKIKVTERPNKPTDCLFCGKIWKHDENGCRESWECEMGGICRNTAECTKLDPEAQVPKEGEWIESEDFESAMKGKVVCSICGEPQFALELTNEFMRMKNQKTNYCPNCGARMKGERR